MGQQAADDEGPQRVRGVGEALRPPPHPLSCDMRCTCPFVYPPQHLERAPPVGDPPERGHARRLPDAGFSTHPGRVPPLRFHAARHDALGHRDGSVRRRRPTAETHVAGTRRGSPCATSREQPHHGVGQRRRAYIQRPATWRAHGVTGFDVRHPIRDDWDVCSLLCAWRIFSYALVRILLARSTSSYTPPPAQIVSSHPRTTSCLTRH